jgi:hypothetical protein
MLSSIVTKNRGVLNMGNDELKKSLESMQSLRKELSSSKEKTLEFLVEAGLVTPDGKLAAPYTRTN